MSKIKEALNETLIEYQGSLPTVNGKASVAEWNLTIKFYTREQCYKFIDLLSKQDVVYSFSFYPVDTDTNTDYLVTVNGMLWAKNLTTLSQLLEQCDYGSF